MSSYRPRQDAFTLVELLVVLGIIAVLMAILLPSISAARQQASRARCLSNVRQIGLGIAVYCHDFGELPPPQLVQKYLPLKVYAPVFYAERRTGLLALRPSAGFYRRYLACPQGWASGGYSDWYEVRGMSSDGSAYMDYAYWCGRYPPSEAYDVASASFTFHRGERRIKILVSDIVVDQSPHNAATIGLAGSGNHASNHSGPTRIVPMTDGRGARLNTNNVIRSTGASVLFSDYHAVWFDVRKLTQQVSGLCYPPPDQW